MPFAYRAHAAFVNLDPGGSMHFRLPPTTPGVIVIKGTFYSVGAVDQPGDHVGGGTPPAPPPEIDWGSLGDLRELRLRGRLERGRRASIGRRVGGGLLDDTVLDPVVDGGGSRPAGELIFELMLGDQVAQRKEDGHNIFYESGASAAAWSLRITRKPDTSNQRRRYRIDATYPKALFVLALQAAAGIAAAAPVFLLEL